MIKIESPIVIIDYGTGNLGSIHNMLRKIGVKSIISSNTDEISRAKKLIIPGVGAFDRGIKKMRDSGLYDLLTFKVTVEKVPVLGICLGMQLMTLGSEEGTLPGFGWVEAETKRFPNIPGLKIPHMGWNLVVRNNHCTLNENLPGNSRFYFVHSYFVDVKDDTTCTLKTEYGISFVSAIRKENIFGVQFHPEKSHKFGMQILKNFSLIG